MAKFSSLLKGLQILVVDAHADSRRLLSMFFDLYDITTVEAASAEEALNIVNQMSPDLLISEVRLPDETGYSLVQKVKERFSTESKTRGVACHAEIPAIALTCHASKGDREEAIAAGFSRHVAKPCNLDELLGVIIELTQPYHRVPLGSSGTSYALCCEGCSSLKTDSGDTPHF
ncbi:MAG: response regulator [Myxacorys californica WJT36-NPBG1]|jgi:CheY-like chemotaxis protein|nr:response regulator [Myxacorys californica WJT36-NPBG1]